MHLRGSLILAALATTALLAVGVSGATARNLSINERHFEAIWSEVLGAPKTKLEFSISFAGIDVRCRVTLLGHFTESTIAKNARIDQGSINHGEIETCAGGEAIIQPESLPWSLRYRTFTGNLPRIRSISFGIIGARVHARPEPNNPGCVIETETNNPGVIILGNSAEAAETGLETTGEVEDMASERETRIPDSGEFLCSAGTGTIRGVGLIRNLPRTAKVRITLI